MKVRELIEMLNDHDGELEIVVGYKPSPWRYLWYEFTTPMVMGEDGTNRAFVVIETTKKVG